MSQHTPTGPTPVDHHPRAVPATPRHPAAATPESPAPESPAPESPAPESPAPANPAALGEVPATQQKRALAEQRAEALRKTQEIKAARDTMKAEMEARISKMQADMRAEMARLEAEMAPLLAHVKQLEEGIWTVNLYLGRDEEIVALRDNNTLPAAPADTPFTLRQAVLSMDEETAAYAESGGIDARSLDVFDAWIAEPANLDRVLPEPKGVVALVPRARGRDYADPWMNQQMGEANRWTYWLIRNGDRVWRMSTDFVVGKRLIPAADEFTGLFERTVRDKATGHDVVETLVPGTDAWDAAEKAQGARERHFMRVALILQGLIDRTTVFHPLPAHGLNLLDHRTYDDGHAVLVRDAEHLLTDGRPDFYTWLAAKTADMRVGMRVMGAFDTATFRDAGEEYTDSGRNYTHYHPNDRITPRARDSYSADKPETGVLYRLEGRKTDRGVTGFTFKFARTSKRLIGSGYDAEYRAPKTKGTCLVAPGDRFILPFDLVTVEECRYYLDARTQRHAYEEMFPLLRACIAAKEAEVAEEAPFRDLLARTLVTVDADLADRCAADPDLSAAHQVLNPLVDWWKHRNKYHRALTGDQAHEAQAIADITAEHQARIGAATSQAADAPAETAMVQRLLAHDPTIMVIGRKRDGSYLAFAPQTRTYPAGPRIGYPATNVDQPAPVTDDEIAELRAQTDSMRRSHINAKQVDAQRQIPAAVLDNVYAVEYTTTKTGRTIKSRTWIQPGTRLDSIRILHTTEVWKRFDLHADPKVHLTDPEIAAAVAELLADIDQHAPAGWPSTSRYQPEPDAPFAPVVLGVTLGDRDATDEPGVRLTAHLVDAADLSADLPAPSAVENNTRRWTSHTVSTRAVKKAGKVALNRHEVSGTFTHRTGDGTTYSTGTAGRPWHYFWDGRARHAIAVAEYPESQALADSAHDAMVAHNKRIRALREDAMDTLTHAYAVANARKEAEVYAAFLDEYVDPELWEGHRKTLHDGDLEVSWHPMGRDIPDLLRGLLYQAADAGLVTDIEITTRTSEGRPYSRVTHQIAGHTIGTLAMHLHPDLPALRDTLTDFWDLPLHPAPADIGHTDHDAATGTDTNRSHP